MQKNIDNYRQILFTITSVNTICIYGIMCKLFGVCIVEEKGKAARG